MTFPYRLVITATTSKTAGFLFALYHISGVGSERAVIGRTSVMGSITFLVWHVCMCFSTFSCVIWALRCAELCSAACVGVKGCGLWVGLRRDVPWAEVTTDMSVIGGGSD
jgi:hypothetical protein